jgi:predicted PurR-regulated permease PerM
MVLGIIVSAILLHYGKNAVEPLRILLANLMNEETSDAILGASGKAIKGVAVGVMGTGLIAALAAWIGYANAGVGIAGILAAITFFLVVIQVGPLLVWLPVALWLGHEGETGRAIFVSIYGIVVLMGIDNILKPILIGKSGKLPILVLFLGVVGGMSAWGFTGMFKGALVLAVFYTLVQTWIIREKGTGTGKDVPDIQSRDKA